MKYIRTNCGFTLTELLVATAIFSIIMTAIAALFVASLHAVKSAYLAADAYETSRGAFNVVERDLSTVFTMRDYGDYYQFYGTPQGMVMVGLIRRADGSTTLGRITYAIYPVVVKDNTEVFRITAPFTAPQLNTNAVNIQVTNNNGTPADLTDDFVEDVKVGTAALVRYIEPGVEDLDTYPFDWNELATDPESGAYVRDQLDDAIGGAPGDSGDPDVLVRLDAVLQERLAARKRELWIRMVSGQDYWYRLLNGLAEELPDAWGDGWLAAELNTSTGLYEPKPLDARDYVVAENIGLETPLVGEHVVPLHPLNSLPAQNFFRYGHGNLMLASNNWEYPTWNSDELAVAGSPLRPRLPEVVTLRLPFAYERPYPSAPQFERDLEQVIDVPTAYTRTALVDAP